MQLTYIEDGFLKPSDIKEWRDRFGGISDFRVNSPRRRKTTPLRMIDPNQKRAGRLRKLRKLRNELQFLRGSNTS